MMCGEGCRGAIHCALVACIVSPCGRNSLRPYMRTLSSHEIVSVKHRSRKNPMHTRLAMPGSKTSPTLVE